MQAPRGAPCRHVCVVLVAEHGDLAMDGSIERAAPLLPRLRISLLL
jgi:hypothetical protein